MEIDEDLVRRLVAQQFAQWSDLPVVAVAAAGTDNAIYRLGEAMVVRLPRLPRAAETVHREQRWLPRFAPALPLAIPTLLGEGVPGSGFPYPWSVYSWLEGETPEGSAEVDLADVGLQLGQFIAALQRIDTTGGPRSSRAVPVSPSDDPGVRSTIRQLGAADILDAGRAHTVWEEALAAPSWDGDPVWIHGDLFPGNLLVRRARLTAVIDFGMVGLGDPASDMLPAWTLLDGPARDLFRAQAGLDQATWVRGRGWALSAAMGAVRVYGAANHPLAVAGRHAIAELLVGPSTTRQ